MNLFTKNISKPTDFDEMVKSANDIPLVSSDIGLTISLILKHRKLSEYHHPRK